MKINPARRAASAVRPPASSRLQKPATVKVRFTLQSALARHVCLAGDFNQWNPTALPLKRGKKGNWSTEIPLAPGSYEYRFVVDGVWETDPAADSVPNPYGTRNSVIHVSAISPHGADGSRQVRTVAKSLAEPILMRDDGT
jgi:1,4-alpha-glucan branching enzyme